MVAQIYKPLYSGSHALVIGINKYKCVSPLAHAVNDAKAVAGTLVKDFGFPSANVAVLLDGDATRDAIMKAYLTFANDSRVRPDDRLLFFYAGHGHTLPGRREAGYLVPVEGHPSELATLIRWDDLTRNADQITAKHILFLMDACYGGLAVTRKPIPSGSSRYLHDMLTRVTRQVITAGKANETVSDGGGTRPGHSLFTAHLLDALEGKGASDPSVITAMGVMSYVYSKVSNDPNSHQTPHFGYVDGDGDFIFKMPAQVEDEKKGSDILIKEPHFDETDAPKTTSIGEQIKGFIPDQSARIRLNDLVMAQLQATTAAIAPSNFPAQGMQQDRVIPTFSAHMVAYQEKMRAIQAVLIQLSRWSETDQVGLIRRVMEDLGESPERRAGFTALTNLDWYPVALAAYAGGIAALAEDRFDSLAAILLPRVKDTLVGDGAKRPVVIPMGYAIVEIGKTIKALPEFERRYSPFSDHMMTAMQPVVEDELYLGRRYEDFFDKFEIMVALTFANERGTRIWGPPGRFAWKENSYNQNGGPFSRFVEDAKAQGQLWPALKAGFFGGSAARFVEVADGYKALIGQLSWY